MTSNHRVMISSVGALTAAAVVVGLLTWGLDGLETLSWVGGVGSFVLAFATLARTLPRAAVTAGVPAGDPQGVGDTRVMRLQARSGDNSPVIMAGGDVSYGGTASDSGDRR